MLTVWGVSGSGLEDSMFVGLGVLGLWMGKGTRSFHGFVGVFFLGLGLGGFGGPGFRDFGLRTYDY